MEYIQVKNWEDFQHYKDRTPPWIKLYNHLLDDFEFSCLPDASKAHLLSIWLLASRTNNKIPNNPKWIGNKINATEPVDLSVLFECGFIEVISNKNNELQTPEQDASKMLQTPEQDACLEREERESREEGEQNYTSATANCPHDEIIALYHKILPANPRYLQSSGDTRKGYLRSRWREDESRQDLSWWERFFTYISQSAFLTGRVDQSQRKPFIADLEWIVKPSNFVKIIEGKYES